MANLEGCGSSGKFEPHFNGKNGTVREKNFGRVIYESETIQNCKNPTGDIDTLIRSLTSQPNQPGESC